MFFNNTTYDHGWQIHANGTGAPSFYNNDISYWTDWFYPGSAYHQDGLFFFGASAATYFPQVFNNYFHGDICGGSPTGMLYLAETDNNDGSGQSANVFNNMFYGTGSSVTCGSLIDTDQWYTNPKGPYGIYNNTFVNTQYLFQQYDGQTSPTFALENNIFYATLRLVDLRQAEQWWLHLCDRNFPDQRLLRWQGQRHRQPGVRVLGAQR